MTSSEIPVKQIYMSQNQTDKLWYPISNPPTKVASDIHDTNSEENTIIHSQKYPLENFGVGKSNLLISIEETIDLLKNAKKRKKAREIIKKIGNNLILNESGLIVYKQNPADPSSTKIIGSSLFDLLNWTSASVYDRKKNKIGKPFDEKMFLKLIKKSENNSLIFPTKWKHLF